MPNHEAENCHWADPSVEAALTAQSALPETERDPRLLFATPMPSTEPSLAEKSSVIPDSECCQPRHDSASSATEIDWDGPNDPENPLNWSSSRKWAATILVSCFTFISPFSSTMVTPALDDIGKEFGIPRGFSQALVMSIFLLGYAQGPFVLAPLSEIYGRVPVLQYANLIYLAFNTACGFAQSHNQLLAFRFLSGIGGSAPQAVCSV